MKKIKLTEDEIDSLKGIYELQKKENDFQQESKLKLQEFWFKFNKKLGPGNYSLNTKELEVLENEHRDEAFQNK